MKKLITAVVLLTCAAASFWILRQIIWNTDSLEAQVEGSSVALSPTVPGKVVSIAVKEGEPVFPGQELYRLESGDLEKVLRDARSLLESLAASLPPELLRDEGDGHELVPLARQEEDQAYKNLQRLSEAKAKADFSLARTRVQYNRGQASQEAVALAVDQAEKAEEALARAKAVHEAASLARVRAERATSRAGGLAERLALYRAQAGQVRMAEDMLAATVIRAPGPGMVTRITVRTGEDALAGAQAIFVMPYTLEHMWVSAHFKPTLKPELTIGSRCVIRLSGFDGPELEGRIIDIFPEEQSSSGKDSLPVRVSLDTYDPASMPAIHPGMKASVRLEQEPK